MRLISIEIENYKSLKKVTVDTLGALNIIIGPNGSGKTNFVEALGYLGDVFKDGLQKAMINYGGFENICYR